MKIAAISDIHGKLSHSVPECDVLAIVGDITPLWSSAERWQSRRELEWVQTKFARWLRRQPAGEIILLGGNHDLFAWDVDTREEAACFLEDQGVHCLAFAGRPAHVNIDRVDFAGNPWTPTIQNRTWAFSAQRTSAAPITFLQQEIGDSCDVLLSHGPPQGLLDRTVSGDRVGCSQLMYHMLSMKEPPALTLCGHIHERRGERMKWYGTDGIRRRIANVSICDENYTERGAKVQTFDL